MIKRYLQKKIKADLGKKMVFVTGPRQVGKTTLALQIIGAKKGYLNWDVAGDREKILKHELPENRILVFDEIHKYRSWRNYLKGLWDRLPRRWRILVIGSARLDYYRFGGDSLQGRYHMLRLHPFSVAELDFKNEKELIELLTLGGFPEPFLGGSEIEARRWSREFRSRLLYEDLSSLETVTDIGKLELAMLRLPELVGAPLSINAFREDLQVSHKVLSRWLEILERLYAIVRLSPFGAPAIRAVRKEQKHYHYDWSLIPDMSKRFENLVAMHLLKWVNYEQDTKGRNLELRYFRDIDLRETDFVICENGLPLYFIETKWSDTEISSGLKYLKNRFPDAEAVQIAATGKKDYRGSSGIRVQPAINFLRSLI
jgi:uncharacterized protein